MIANEMRTKLSSAFKWC